MSLMKKRLPIGIEDFSEIRTGGFYYVDKTGLIKELLDNWSKVTLFTRPRRFGKSLNMSMLKYFFEIGSNRELFEELEIADDKSLCEEYMGKFPVISVSLKSVSGNDFETACYMLSDEIRREAGRFQFLADSQRLTEYYKKCYSSLLLEENIQCQMPANVMMNSLAVLSGLLRKHFGSKVIILIDEYDVPLAKAYEYGYYEQMVLLVRNMFEQALKSNDSLQFAMLTGCMRIAKESIFTGLNNLRVLTITDVEFEEHFGFTDSEVRKLLEYYDLSVHYDTIRAWYDGYQFGNEEVYCPWDVICYCSKLRVDPAAEPQAYWSNTSGNDAVRRFIREADNGSTKREIERLVAGEIIPKEIHQELTYRDMYQNIDNIWSVLFTTGYLTQRGRIEGEYLNLAIETVLEG